MDYTKFASRKLLLSVLGMGLSALALYVKLIDQSAFVQLQTLCIGSYTIANVWQQSKA
jgi:hypothetical protein